MENELIIFKDKEIRRTLHNGEWMFAVEDICGALMDRPNGNTCWRKLKHKLRAEGCDVATLCYSLAFSESGGKAQRTDCAGLEAVFRIVQSIASPKAEVFKRWLAMTGWRGKKPQDRYADLDSILSMLEDTATAAITGKRIPRTTEDYRAAARKADLIAEEARKQLETGTGVKTVGSGCHLIEQKQGGRE